MKPITRGRQQALLATGLISFDVLAVTCGARTQLFDEESSGAGGRPPIMEDAGADSGVDAVADASADAGPPVGCEDPNSTRIYLLSLDGELFSFFPPTVELESVGVVRCPAAVGATPWSMAVARDGMAYTVYSDGELFELSTSDASCEATAYRPGQHGFNTFGMGYAADGASSETLFVADSTFEEPSRGLGHIDTDSFDLSYVGRFSFLVQRIELSGTPDGRLFGHSPNPESAGSHIYELDKVTAEIIADHPLSAGGPTLSHAFAYWGGDFYVFTGADDVTAVTRWHLANHEESFYASIPTTIVGAGVSTCAPL